MLYAVENVERQPLGFQMGLHQRLGRDAGAELLDAQGQLVGHRGIAIGEGPRLPAERCGKFGGIDLQQPRRGSGLGPQPRRHLDDDNPLLAADAQGLDNRRDQTSLGRRRGELLQLDAHLLPLLGRLEQLDGDLLLFVPRPAGSTDHCRTLASKTLTTL